MPIGLSRSQILLHWLLVVLVGLQWFSHGGVGALVADGSADDPFLPLIHILAGAGTFVAALASMVLAHRQGREAPDATIAPVVRTLEWLVRNALYLTLLVLPLSGAWSALIDAGSTGLHRRIAGLLLFLVLVHLVLIAWHILRQDKVLERMIRPEAPPVPTPPKPLGENAIAETEPKSEQPIL